MSLATITQLVADKLRTAQLGSELGGSAERDRAIAQAVLQYGLDRPQQVFADVASVTGSTLALPGTWVAGRSLLLAVEYPIGLWPVSTLEAAVLVGSSSTVIFLADDTLTDATVRVHFSAPHQVDNSTCTVPAQDLNAVACWAAAELCRQLATAKGHDRDATLTAAAVNGGSQSGELARRAKDWLREYRNALGLPDPDRASVAPASTVVSWGADRRPRPRLYSLGQ